MTDARVEAIPASGGRDSKTQIIASLPKSTQRHRKRGNITSDGEVVKPRKKLTVKAIITLFNILYPDGMQNQFPSTPSYFEQLLTAVRVMQCQVDSAIKFQWTPAKRFA